MLAVEAALVAQCGGWRVRIDANGSVITCRVEADARNVLRVLLRSRSLLTTLRMLSPRLIRAGLRIDFVAAGLRIVAAGTGVRQNTVARLLRLPGTRIGG